MKEQHVQDFAKLMQSEWLKLVENEGAAVVQAEAPADPDADPPCPACGTAAPLVDGACSDCGLHLG